MYTVYYNYANYCFVESINIGENSSEWIVTQVFDKDSLERSTESLLYLIEKMEEGNDALEVQAGDAFDQGTMLRTLSATLERRATQSEQRALLSEIRATDLQNRTQQAWQRCQQEQARLDELNNQVLQLQAQAGNNGDQSWVIQRDEIDVMEEVIGRGRWGPIKAANFRGKRVAAKMLQGIAVSQHNIQIFERSFTIASQLCHPNLVQFIGATVERASVILFELLPTNLRSELNRTRLRRNQVVAISKDVALALNYLHKRRTPVIHRDISSENVLLLPRGVDQWTAKLSNSSTMNFIWEAQTQSPGNPLYAAPEAHIPGQHSTKMDVFSFGILAMELVTGRRPIRPVVIDAQIMRQQIQVLQWPDMEDIMNNCIVLEKDNRPEISHVLQQLRAI